MDLTLIKQIEAHKIETTTEFTMPVPQELYEQIYRDVQLKLGEWAFDMNAVICITTVKKVQKKEGIIKEVNIL